MHRLAVFRPSEEQCIWRFVCPFAFSVWRPPRPGQSRLTSQPTRAGFGTFEIPIRHTALDILSETQQLHVRSWLLDLSRPILPKQACLPEQRDESLVSAIPVVNLRAMIAALEYVITA